VYIDPTVPFASAYQRQSHFDSHGHEVGATSEEEYERMADEFMTQAPTANIYDGICLHARFNNFQDRIRLDNVSRWFGIAYDTLTVRTLHTKPRSKISNAGGPRAFVDRKCLEIR
jgi:hypothetical protein